MPQTFEHSLFLFDFWLFDHTYLFPVKLSVCMERKKSTPEVYFFFSLV